MDALQAGYSRSLDRLHPAARKRVDAWLRKCDEAGHDVLVYCTERSALEQARLWRTNRTAAQVAWRAKWLRSMGLDQYADALEDCPPQPGPPPATFKTKAAPGLSFHQRHLLSGDAGALAVDFVPLVGGKARWGTRNKVDRTRWLRCGELAEDAGLTWGGRWRASGDPKLGWDPVHVQFDDCGAIKILPLLQGAYR